MSATRTLTDYRALNLIENVLSGQPWDSDTLDRIAELVRETGRTVADNFHADAPPAEGRATP